MRKRFLIKSIVGILLFSIFFLSCEKNSNEECSTCQSENYEEVMITLNESSFESRKYPSNDFGSYYQVKLKEKTKTYNFLNSLAEQIQNIDVNKISGFIYVTSNISDSDLNYAKLENLIIYENNVTNFNVRVFKNENNKFTEISSLSNLKTSMYSTNDIYNILNLVNESKKLNVYSFIFPKFPDFKTYEVELSKVLKKALNYDSRIADDPSKKCGTPCQLRTKDRICRGIPQDLDGYNISYICDKECKTEEIENKLLNSSNNNYNYSSIKNELWLFRDLYLDRNIGGEKIIGDYYALSDSLRMENFDLDICIRTYDLISDDISPIIRELNTNPTSNNILYDSDFKQKITDYLLDVKELYNDIESKNKIDNIISKIDYFCNKSNSFITNNLNEY